MAAPCRIVTHSPDETIALGREIGRHLRAGDILTLSGDLGAGKTTLTKGIAEGLGIPGDVFSPTFTIIHEYVGPCPLYHIDLYRISGEEAVLDLGLDEYFASKGICIVEWGDRLGGLAPKERLDVVLSLEGEDIRRVELTALCDRFLTLLEHLRSAYTGH